MELAIGTVLQRIRNGSVVRIWTVIDIIPTTGRYVVCDHIGQAGHGVRAHGYCCGTIQQYAVDDGYYTILDQGHATIDGYF